MKAPRPADVALGELSERERAVAEELMAADPGYRAEVDRLRSTAGSLSRLEADAWEGGDPLPVDLEAIAGPGAAASPARPVAATAGRRRALVLRPALALACAALLVGAGVGAGLLLAPSGDTTTADGRPVRLAPLEGAPAPAGERASVRLPGQATGTVDLRARHLPASAPGTYYEVWLMTDAHRLASIGTFRVPPSGTVHVRFTVGVDPAAYRYVDVSVERDDGRPEHSGNSVLRSGALS